ncbi:two-component sensor histidine kinase [Spartobacteria bacterium LR76]|nr:two-component sensor histidine kinase [Spartobacteria bacterium LR76]
MKLWPRTLTGQLVLVLLLALAISQIVTLFIYRFERARALRVVIGEECLGRAVSAFRLAEGVTPDQRKSVLKTIETPLTRYWLTRDEVSSEEWQKEARDHLLKPTSAAGSNNPTASMFAREAMLSQISSASWRELPGGTWLLQKPLHILDLAVWNGFGFKMQLHDGEYLNMIYAKPEYLMQSALTPGYYTALVITVLIFAGAALLIARRIVRPLRHLTKSAERLGRGHEVEILKEEGPEDIRATISAFNRMQVRLNRFLTDRTRMLAAISHDLRTPITSLRLRTEFIADEEMRQKFNATLDEMQGMAEASLSFAKSESTAETTRVVDLDALLESICDDITELGGNVDLTSPGRLPYKCRADSLRRALRNIIENAVRYGECARVTLHRHSDRIDITVEDDGPGIPVADRERVFEPFVRLESSRNRDTGGVGLGLSIARSIIRNHGGEITLSQGNKGLRVLIQLPPVCPNLA